jgi:hypothetical protein
LWWCGYATRGSKSDSVESPFHLAKQACASHLLYLLIENSSQFLKLLPETNKKKALLLRGDELQGTL